MDSIGYIQAWDLWFSGYQLTDKMLWGKPIFYWGRAGKLLQILGLAPLIIEIIGFQVFHRLSEYLDVFRGDEGIFSLKEKVDRKLFVLFQSEEIKGFISRLEEAKPPIIDESDSEEDIRRKLHTAERKLDSILNDFYKYKETTEEKMRKRASRYKSLNIKLLKMTEITTIFSLLFSYSMYILLLVTNKPIESFQFILEAGMKIFVCYYFLSIYIRFSIYRLDNINLITMKFQLLVNTVYYNILSFFSFIFISPIAYVLDKRYFERRLKIFSLLITIVGAHFDFLSS